jgi:hypothetical protein
MLWILAGKNNDKLAQRFDKSLASERNIRE